MKTGTFELLRCPYCGWRLDLVTSSYHRTDGDDKAVCPLRTGHCRDVERDHGECIPEAPRLLFPIGDKLFGLAPLARRKKLSRYRGQIGFLHCPLRRSQAVSAILGRKSEEQLKTPIGRYGRLIKRAGEGEIVGRE